MQDEPDYWGDSIGYRPIGEPDMVEVADGVEVPVYSDGIHREISTLPEQNAASLFTMPSVQQQEVSRMNAKVLKALERLRDKHGLDQEVLDEFVALADQTNRTVDDEDLITRDDADQESDVDEPAEELDEADEPEDEEPESDEDPEPEPQERDDASPGGEDSDDQMEVELDEEAVEAIVDRVAEHQFFTDQTARLDEIQASITGVVERLDEFNAKVEEAESRLADLERDDEEKQREWLDDQPRRRTVRVTHRPRQANSRDKGGNGNEPRGSLAEEAEATLDAMPKY